MERTIYEDLESFRQALREAKGWSSGYKEGIESVPYNMQDELMSSSIETCKKQFGADFENFKTPMSYYPQDGDVVLSGEIGSLNNAKFQFRLKDPTGEGCFIWTEPIQLTEANLNQLKVVYGVFKNWKNDLETAEDKKPMGLQNNRKEDTTKEEQMQQQTPQQQTVQPRPGDDY